MQMSVANNRNNSAEKLDAHSYLAESSGRCHRKSEYISLNVELCSFERRQETIVFTIVWILSAYSLCFWYSNGTEIALASVKRVFRLHFSRNKCL